MKPFQAITSVAVPLPMKDVDTDLIIPAQFLTSVSRDGYGQNLFCRLRESDANFPLNKPQYASAEVLITDSNFGCGSSREHAVWALQGAGFRALIGKSFADIFASNSAKNGLLLVVLPETQIDQLLLRAQQERLEINIDLETQTIAYADNDTGREIRASFGIDPFGKHCMLQGLDDLDYILSHQAAIDRYRNDQSKHRVYSTLEINNSK